MIRNYFHRPGLQVIALAAAASVGSCVHMTGSHVDNSPSPSNRDNPKTSNVPPCALPPLSEKEILEVARQAFGEEASQQGLPPPNWRIEQAGCRYRYVQSIFYIDNKPAPIDGLDYSSQIYIARDKTYTHW
jgi:hypothetical protein